MEEYKLFIKRIGLVGLVNILVSLSGILLIPILTKNLSILDYGVWVQINTTLILISSLVNLGLPYAMFRLLAVKKDKKDISEGFYSIFFLTILSSAVASLLFILFSRWISEAIFNGNLTVTLILSFVILIIGLNNVLFGFLRALQKIKRFSLFWLIQTYLNVFLVSYFVLNGQGIVGAVSGILICQIIIFAIVFSLILAEIGFKIPKFNNMKEYLSFGIPGMPNNLSYWVVDSSDRYLIGLLLGSAFVAYYSPGYSIGMLIFVLMVPFDILLTPLLSRYFEENRIEEVKKLLQYSMKYFLLSAIPSVFALGLLSKPILMILTTTEIALSGYYITPLVALSTTIFGLYMILAQIILLDKKMKIIGTSWIIAGLSNVILNLILIPYIGILGAGFTTLVSYSIMFFVALFYTLKNFKFDFEVTPILKSIMASIIIGIFIILYAPSSITEIFLAILICSGIYIGLMGLLRALTKEELKFMKSLVIK